MLSEYPPNSPNEILDLEVLATSGRRPPAHHRYFKVKVDLEYFTFDDPRPTGRQILVKAGKIPPERFILRQRNFGHQTREIGLDEHVDLAAPGVERFVTLPRDQTDGLLRRQVELSVDDVKGLEEFGLPWETIQDQAGLWVLQHERPVLGLSAPQVSVAVRMEPGYPRTALDMVYVYPALTLPGGRVIPATEAMQPLDGKSWQRWSRHYTPANPWRPGIDSVSTHLVLAGAWFEEARTR